MRLLMKFSLILCLGFSIVACSDLDDANADEGVIAQSFSVGGSDCLELVYPVTIALPDGSEVSAESEEEIVAVKMAFKEENPDTRAKIEFVYPIQVTTADGETVEVTSGDMLKELKKDCKGEGGRGNGNSRNGNSRNGKGGSCVDFVYPLTYILVDGTSITVESKTELKEAIQAWKEANPDTSPEVTLQFPIQIVQEDVTIDVATAEELQVIKEECKGDRSGRGQCFEVVYPVTFLLSDGTTVSGESRQEIRTAIKEWKEVNPDVDADASLQFPIQITQDGETIEVASEEALEAIKEEC